MPHFWIPMTANPHPWDQKKAQVRQAIGRQNPTSHEFLCEKANPRQGYVLVEDPANIGQLARDVGVQPSDVVELVRVP